ncbi:MAG: hypothetical protein OXM61_10650 [Candidatus Poribacteria bacterium]|nr:hypothetical protein [Candidatus Poribacteria bacterium]
MPPSENPIITIEVAHEAPAAPAAPTAPTAPTVPANEPSLCMFYRDEIFDVEITVKIVSANYDGTMKLELLADTKEQTLGNRRNIQMYDFGREEGTGQDRRFITGITQLTFSETDFKGTEPVEGGVTVRRVYKKTFKAVINVAQTVKIKATHVKTPQQNYNLSGETGDIHIGYRLRQYTTHNSNDTVNNYDDKIVDQLNRWDDWDISPPPPQNQGGQTPQNQAETARPYTFMTDARPDGELVKAIAYKESRLATKQNPSDQDNLDLMRVPQSALNRMTTGHANVEEDVNASELLLNTPDREAELDDDNCIVYLGTYSGPKAAAQLMNYAPVVNTADNSFRWGIRWLIAKRTVHGKKSVSQKDGSTVEQVIGVKRINWLVHDGAVKAYPKDPDNSAYVDDPNYVMHVRRLYAEGMDPNSGTSPTYLWPIKSDGSARQ